MQDDELAMVIREKYKDRKICIAYPSPEETGFMFNVKLMELVLQNSNKLNIQSMNAVGGTTIQSRNAIVESAKKFGMTDILWVDSNCVFPIHGLLRLLRHDKDIVGTTNAGRHGELAVKGVEKTEDGLLPMAITGFPFTLTKMSVFEKLRKPYFAEPPRWALPEIAIRQEDVVAEDEYFSHFARQAGFDIWCDTALSMEIGYVKTEVFYITPPIEKAKDIDIVFDNEKEHREADGIGE